MMHGTVCMFASMIQRRSGASIFSERFLRAVLCAVLCAYIFLNVKQAKNSLTILFAIFFEHKMDCESKYRSKFSAKR